MAVAFLGVLVAGAAFAQAPSDGVFAAGEPRVVWKNAAAYDQWQRTNRTRVDHSLIACMVDPGTPFVIRFAIPPRGLGIEVVDGPRKGCQGVALSEAVEIHPQPTLQPSPPGTPPSSPRHRQRAGTTVNVEPPLRPLIPPLPPGGALPIRPGLR